MFGLGRSWGYGIAAWIVIQLGVAAADDYVLHSFRPIQLTDTYYSEGANFGDLNGDGQLDAIHGPFWFAGPEFQQRREIYPPVAQNRQGYADNFFSWVYDFNGDGRNDILTVGFPGTPAFVYENPGEESWDKHWPKHEIFDWVSNESPQFLDIVADERPELVCSRDGYFGYATIDWDEPWAAWTFHKISGQVTDGKFGHGLGVGDVDGDGRQDVLTQDGWFQQPTALAGDPLWSFHPVEFTAAGGAEMYAYDVDGDGDNDIITSLAAHDYGLAWFEQVRDGDQRAFIKHIIMNQRPDENRYGLVFTELHSVNLVDIDGDGLKDIVTGKTYWSHHTKSPLWDAGAVVYWFRLVRGPDGVDWVPYLINGDTGIGRQVSVADANGDQLPDIVVGGMKGASVLMHEVQKVERATYEAAQPRPVVPLQAGLEPEAAAKNMTVPGGFQVILAAGEPDIHQPVGFCLDARGRVWVAEAYNYPLRAPEGEGKDKIVILEDTDRNGTLDSRKVFIEGLNLVSGLEVGFGGVWVGAAPYLMFIPDADGNDQPDGPPQILLDGFGYEDTHETLNAFIWGPDGWLYGCHGVFTHSRVGKPGTPDEQRTPMNAAVWRYHPLQHRFEVFAWGTSNPWGVDFNDQGQAFITACVIPHLWHVVQGARYHRQGGVHFDRYFYDDIKTIADHSHYVGDIGEHAWWGHEPLAPPDTLRAGGGHAHCGAMIYLGDNWPSEYRNQIFMNNIHGNRVNMDVLERNGSSFIGHHGPDFLLANDQWFRGINLKYGPDGSVYLIDWYDRNACHRTNPEIWDRTNGRIYNVAYGEVERRAVDLEKHSDLELAELQLHPNDWYVRTARRILQQRAANKPLDRAAIARLQEILRQHPDVTRRLRAMWVLQVTGHLTDALRRELLADDEEYLRAWAIQFEAEDGEVASDVAATLVKLAANDPSPVVRLYLASAAMRLPESIRWSLGETLVRQAADADDHNLPLMDWYVLEPLLAAEPARALKLAQTCQIPTVQRFIVRRVAADSAGLEHVVAALGQASEPGQQMFYLNEILKAFEGRLNIPMPKAWAATYEKLTASSDVAVRDRADQIAVVLGDKRVHARIRQLLASGDAPIEKRLEALDILVRGQDRDAAKTYQQVLSDERLRGPALRALATLEDPQTPAAILGIYAGLAEKEKRDAISTLVARPKYAQALLDAIAAGAVPRTDLHAYNVRQLVEFNDEALTKRLADVWGEIRGASEDSQKIIEHYKTLLTSESMAKANPANGRRVFDATCASCHILFGEGGKVGPDITGSNRANLDYILENLVDPSAVLGKDYRMTIIETVDGRVISGLIMGETESAVTLRTINEAEVLVAVDDIESRRLSDLSVMPERQLDQLPPDDVRDLVAYLASPHQVAPRGPRAPIDESTGGVPGALEGETLKVVGKTEGTAKNQDMQPFAKDRWSGADHLWWTGAKPGSKLELEFDVAESGLYDAELVMTRAQDYGIVQLAIDGIPLGGALDLYNAPDVVTTGVLAFPSRRLEAGAHKLEVTIVGANPQAVPAYMFGLDYLRLVPKSND